MLCLAIPLRLACLACTFAASLGTALNVALSQEITLVSLGVCGDGTSATGHGNLQIDELNTRVYNAFSTPMSNQSAFTCIESEFDQYDRCYTVKPEGEMGLSYISVADMYTEERDYPWPHSHNTYDHNGNSVAAKKQL